MIDVKKMTTTTRTRDADGAVTGVVASGDKEEEEEEEKKKKKKKGESDFQVKKKIAMKDNDNDRNTPRRLAVGEANTNDEENEKLNELQKHQAELLAEYKVRGVQRSSRERPGGTQRIGTRMGKVEAEVSRNHRQCFED